VSRLPDSVTVAHVALAICLLFDGATDRAVRTLWSRLEERGVPTLAEHTHGLHVPHLSYVVLLDWHLPDVLSALGELPDRGPFELRFDAVGAFRRGRINLVPAVPPDLVARQREVVEATAATGATVHRHYACGHWLPHCSLATRARLDQLADVAAAAYDVLPLTARVSSVAVINSSTGQRWPIPHIP
jgi:hypothetical protein